MKTTRRCLFDRPLISAFESGRGGLYSSYDPGSSYGFTPSEGTDYLPSSTFTDSYIGDGNRRGDTDISHYDEGNGNLESSGEAAAFDGAVEGYGGGGGVGGAFGGEEGVYDIQTGGYRPLMGENEGSYVGSTGDSYMVPVRRQDMYNSPLYGSMNPYYQSGSSFNPLLGRNGDSSPVTD